MPLRLTEFCRKTWHDPVWSKVIASAIVASLAIVSTWVYVYPRLGNKPEPPLAALDGRDPLTQEERGFRNLTIPTCERGRNLREIDAIARQIPSQDAREAEFANLVTDAICTGDEQFALEAFSRLTLPRHRDDAARAAVAIYLGRGRYADANKWASLLSDPYDRRWWLERILSSAERSGTSVTKQSGDMGDTLSR